MRSALAPWRGTVWRAGGVRGVRGEGLALVVCPVASCSPSNASSPPQTLSASPDSAMSLTVHARPINITLVNVYTTLFKFSRITVYLKHGC